MWCSDCRGVVIKRSTLIARLAGFLSAGALWAYIFLLVGTSPRFLMVYLVMIAAAYFFVYKLTQRVAFEVIRGRGVPPPNSTDDDG